MRIVLDTNVLVSALLTPHGYPAQVLNAVSTGRITLAVDDRILGEWRDVLLRDKFGFDPATVHGLMANLEKMSDLVVASPLRLRLPDPDDQPFAEVAMAAGVDVIVNGNQKDFEPVSGELPITVISPREMVERLAE